MIEYRKTKKQKLETGDRILIVNEHLNNYNMVLEVKSNDPNEGIVIVKDARGSSKGYFYEDFRIYGE